MRHFALLRTESNQWAFGEASAEGFQCLSSPPEEGGYFWSPDFFMEEPLPFLKPKRFLFLNTRELRENLQSFTQSPFSPPFPFENLRWKKTPKTDYKILFDELQEKFLKGELEKAVPVVVDSAELEGKNIEISLKTSLLFLFDHLAKLPNTLFPFILHHNREWMFGATPETLIRQSEGRLQTHAVAGTTADLAKNLLQDPKEMKEHLFVVHELEQILSSYGTPRKGKTFEKTLPHLKHLVTDLELDFHNADFNKIIDIASHLHPTPALGGFPKDKAFQWLKKGAARRRRYGAPFGYVSPEGEAHIVVAIRALQVIKQTLLSIAGAGLVRESHFENEWNEILLKKKSVFRIFQESGVE